jgi:CHASE2 domain-containing sensor protein
VKTDFLKSSIAWLTTAKRILLSHVIMSFIIGAAIGAITLNLDFNRIEAFFYDLRIQLSGSNKLDERIALLAIADDENNYLALNSISSHAKVLELLIAQKPTAIAFLNHFDPSDVEYNKADAERFVSLAKEAARLDIDILVGTDVDLGGEILAPYPLSTLAHFPAIVHKDGTIFSEDKVTRRALLTVMGEPSLHLYLANPAARSGELLNNVQKSRGAHYFASGEVWHHLIRYPGNTGLSKSEIFPFQTYSQLLKIQSASSFKNKIVLIVHTMG